MDLAQAVNTRLAAEGSLTALIGTRYHWGERDQGGTLPAVVMSQASRVFDNTLEEEGHIIESNIRASCLANSHAQAWAVADAVKAALEGEASVSGFLFWEPDFFGPIDLTVPVATGPIIHEAVLEITLRHSAAT
jgi:hypothetical protein